MPPPAEDDTRTTSQRRADALGDLAYGFLEGSQTPTVGGEKPHLNVHVDLPALQAKGGGLHETTTGFVIDPFLVSQLACDPSVTRIVFGPDSEVLDVGRKTRVIPAGLRRAVVARDRHCVAASRASARAVGSFLRKLHPVRRTGHIVAWADGGETSLDNLCLLCRYHHSQVHLGQLTLEDLNIKPLATATRQRSTYKGVEKSRLSPRHIPRARGNVPH